MKSFLFLSYVAIIGKTIHIIITKDVSMLVNLSSWAFSNRPFPSSLGNLFQNEARCSAFDMEMIFYSHANETHFHKKGCAPSLSLKVRVFGFWKWHISLSVRKISFLKKIKIQFGTESQSCFLLKQRHSQTSQKHLRMTFWMIDIQPLILNFVSLSEESSLWGRRSSNFWTSQSFFSNETGFARASIRL